MKKNTSGSKKTVKAARDAVIKAAVQIDLMKKRTSDFAKAAEKKWEGTRSRRQVAKKELEKAAKTVLDFERDVKEGIRQGLAEVKKKAKK